ncbi:MAG: AmmeMemoRadiSam system radical SAM enzyme [Fibrobacterota bacterium]
MNRRQLLTTLAAASAYPACAGLLSKNNMAEGQIFKRDAPGQPWKWSREADHYERAGEKVKCLVCPNHCELSPGDRSACRNKVNIDGTLFTLAYGNPCAARPDPVEKKPLFHFHPGSSAFSLGTSGCNLRCLNCQNWEISQKKPEEIGRMELFPDAAVTAARQSSCQSVAFTYSEPVAHYEYMMDTAKRAKAAGLKNVWVTNGYISRAALEPLLQVIDAANVDLKAFSEKTYNELNGGHLKFVLETLSALKEAGIWLEVTTLMVPGYTDDLATVQGVAGWMVQHLGPDVPLHLSRFFPAHKLEHVPPTAVDQLLAGRDAARKAGLRFVYVGNVPGDGYEDTQCPGCKKTVIRRAGYAIAEMRVDRDGKCGFCGKQVPGRF